MLERRPATSTASVMIAYSWRRGERYGSVIVASRGLVNVQRIRNWLSPAHRRCPSRQPWPSLAHGEPSTREEPRRSSTSCCVHLQARGAVRQVARALSPSTLALAPSRLKSARARAGVRTGGRVGRHDGEVRRMEIERVGRALVSHQGQSGHQPRCPGWSQQCGCASRPRRPQAPHRSGYHRRPLQSSTPRASRPPAAIGAADGWLYADDRRRIVSERLCGSATIDNDTYRVHCFSTAGAQDHAECVQENVAQGLLSWKSPVTFRRDRRPTSSLSSGAPPHRVEERRPHPRYLREDRRPENK